MFLTSVYVEKSSITAKLLNLSNPMHNHKASSSFEFWYIEILKNEDHYKWC